MKDTYHAAYLVLGLRVGASWLETRKVYRERIHQWHPDRYPGESRLLAEEKTKEITRAYKTLADYHAQHGTMPTVEAAIPPVPEAPPVREAQTREPAGHVVPEPATPAVDAAETTGQPRDEWFGWKPIAALLAGVALFYLWNMDDDSGTNPVPAGMDSGAVVDKHLSATNNGAPGSGATFTIGSKLGEVYAIQGIPTQTDEGVWHYGKSKVYFSNGKVTRWEDTPENPLRATLEATADHPANRLIVHGSSKDEVRAIQGLPWQETSHEWRYGESRIYFNGDYVSGWDESPLNPLRVGNQDESRPASKKSGHQPFMN